MRAKATRNPTAAKSKARFPTLGQAAPLLRSSSSHSSRAPLARKPIAARIKAKAKTKASIASRAKARTKAKASIVAPIKALTRAKMTTSGKTATGIPKEASRKAFSPSAPPRESSGAGAFHHNLSEVYTIMPNNNIPNQGQPNEGPNRGSQQQQQPSQQQPSPRGSNDPGQGSASGAKRGSNMDRGQGRNDTDAAQHQQGGSSTRDYSADRGVPKQSGADSNQSGSNSKQSGGDSKQGGTNQGASRSNETDRGAQQSGARGSNQGASHPSAPSARDTDRDRGSQQSGSRQSDTERGSQQSGSRQSDTERGSQQSGSRQNDIDRGSQRSDFHSSDMGQEGSASGSAGAKGAPSYNRGSDMGQGSANIGASRGSTSANRGSDRNRDEAATLNEDEDMEATPERGGASDVGVRGAHRADQVGSHDEDADEDMSSRGGSGAGGFGGSNADRQGGVANQGSDLSAGSGSGVVRSSISKTGNAGSSLVGPRTSTSGRQDQDALQDVESNDAPDNEEERPRSQQDRSLERGDV